MAIRIEKYQWVFLVLALTTSFLTHYFALFTSYMIKWIDTPDFSYDYLGFLAFRSINALTWVLVLLRLFMKYFDKNHPILPRFNESILPIYLLHQTFIILLGFYVVQLNLGILPKFFLILTGISCSLYITYKLIQQVPLLRFFFGMKPKKPLQSQ